MTEVFVVEDQDGAVVAAYASRQTAEQHAERDGLDVRRFPVLTQLREY